MEEKKKLPVSKIKYDKQGRYIFLRLDLRGLHEAIGILEDVKVDVMNMIRRPRLIKAQEIQLKARAEQIAKENKRKALGGGGSMVKGLKANSKLIR